MGNARRQRPRQARSIRNDERILDAACELLSDAGWGGFALATVAPRAGLSKRPILDRFPDRQALAAAVWRDRVVPELLPAIRDLMAPEARLHADDLEQALEPFLNPSSQMLAASELLVVREYEPRIRRTVDATLKPVFEEFTDPQVGRLNRADAARNAYLVAVAFGLLECAPGGSKQAPDIGSEVKSLAEALATAAKPVKQPNDSASHLEAGFVFDTDDELHSEVLQVVLEEVGKRGFDGATTNRIAHLAGVSEGYIFGRYKTKMDLFLDASNRSLKNNAMLNHEFMERIAAKGSAGLAEAVAMREFMAPGRELLRSIQLEQVRLTRHSPALRAAADQNFEDFLDALGGYEPLVGASSVQAARFHFALAAGVGASQLAQLRPSTWTLPYDVVTIPFSTLL